jgi:3-methyladenine DNA glycosylase AlkD
MEDIIIKDLKKVSNNKVAQGQARFFKTGKGQYGYGDKFAGIKTPDLAKIIKRYYKEISLKQLEYFVSNPIHEYRTFGFMCLVHKYEMKDSDKKEIFIFFKKHIKYLNNWDLVDITTPHIIGEYLKDKDRKWLYTLSQSKNLWYRRISIISTFAFIRDNDFNDTLKICAILINDKEDLIHKATGWMLREVGKRDIKAEEKFLKKYYKIMPRTMLRYAIEKFEETKRKAYLLGLI